MKHLPKNNKEIIKDFPSSAEFIKEGISEILKDSEYKLRTTQSEAFEALCKCSAEKIAHSYFKLPTGVGKTYMFSALSKAYLEESKKNGQKKKVLILVPRLTLIEQTKDSLKNFLT